MSSYPDPYGEELKLALARRHGMRPAEVLIGNGSTQLIYLLCGALRPRTALVVGPAFSEYANALTLAGADVRVLSNPADGTCQFSARRLMAAWEKNCDVIFLATPNSVTGQSIPRTEIASIARAAMSRNSLVVVDEAFVDFSETDSIKTLVRNNPNLIVLRSLTKYYALPGIRLGFLFGEAHRIAWLAAFQEPWAVNAPALTVGLACLEDKGFTAQTDRWLAMEKEFLFRRLTALEGFRPLPSKTNFLLVRIEKFGGSASQLRAFLMREKVLIRTCDSFTGLGVDYFRIAVKRRKDNRRLLGALRRWSESLNG